MTDKTNGLTREVITFLRDRQAQGMAKGTLQFYRGKLAAFTAFAGKHSVEDVEIITPDLLRGYLLQLAEDGHTPGGIHCYYRALRTFLLWWEAETEPTDYKNPIRRVKPPKVPEEALDPVELADVAALLDTCGSDFHGQRDKAIITTLLDTGVRAGELVRFDLADLDISNSSLLVRKSKSKKPRSVFFGAKTRRALRAWIRKRGPDPGALFQTERGDRLKFWGLREVIRRRSKDAGIDPPGLHDFRRAFCLAQLRAGVDVLSISRLLGHASTVLVWRYAKQTAIDLQDKYRSPLDSTED